jgi:hypothetical protein
MKNLLFLLMLSAFAIVSCKKDDDNKQTCDLTTVETTLVGNWEETPILGVGGTVNFKSDKTGSCDDNSLFVTEVNGNVSKTFTWSLSADKTGVTLDYPNGVKLTYTVKSVECDVIKLDFGGIVVTINRK